MGAPKPEEVLKQWREVYGQYRNITSFVKEIVFFIFNNWTPRTEKKIKQI